VSRRGAGRLGGRPSSRVSRRGALRDRVGDNRATSISHLYYHVIDCVDLQNYSLADSVNCQYCLLFWQLLENNRHRPRGGALCKLSERLDTMTKFVVGHPTLAN